MDTTTVGVDLAKNVFVACVADCAGRIVERREFNREGFLTWLGTLPAGIVIGMEARLMAGLIPYPIVRNLHPARRNTVFTYRITVPMRRISNPGALH